MNKWIAEFELEDGDTMPEHMDLKYMGLKIDFRCRPKEDVLGKIKAEIAELQLIGYATVNGKREIASRAVMQVIDKYKKTEVGE